MIVLNLMRSIGDIVYQGCKKIYDVTISPIVNLACKILFSEKAAPPERITRPVSQANDQHAPPSTSRVEQLVPPFFPLPPPSNLLNPPRLPQQFPHTTESNHREETIVQEDSILQEETIVQEERVREETVAQEEPVRQEPSVVHETVVEAETVLQEEKIIPRSPPKAEKSLITYAGNSEIPYFLNRKGFPNSSYRNCSFNSLAVLCAHTGCSIPLIHPDNEELYKQLDTPHFEEAVRQRIDDLIKQKEEFSLKLKNAQDIAEQIKDEKVQVQKELEELKNELELLENEKSPLISKTDIHIDDPLPPLRRELSKLKKELKEYEKTNEEDGETKRLKSEIYKIQIKINNIELEAIRFENLKKLPQQQLEEKIQSKRNQIDRKKQELEKITKEHQTASSCQFNNEYSEKRLEREIEDMQAALERQAQLSRGAEILAILRGEKEGELTMQGAQLLCGIINTTISRNIYRGPADVRSDAGRIKLREALYDSDWRGLRVGGHGHWWVYIRNSDGQTVDEINDSHVYRKRMTIDELFHKYSNPDEWSQTQITFFDGLKP